MTGSELREIRLRLGLTQGEMAKVVGVSRVTLNRWERNVQRISEPIARLVRQRSRTTRRKR